MKELRRLAITPASFAAADVIRARQRAAGVAMTELDWAKLARAECYLDDGGDLAGARAPLSLAARIAFDYYHPS